MVEEMRVDVGYTEVEYTQSNGNAYIDTGYCANQGTKIDITFKMLNTFHNNAVFGGETGYNTNAFHLYGWNNSLDIGFGTQHSVTLSDAVINDSIINHVCRLVMDKDGYVLYSETGTVITSVSYTTSDFTSPYSCCLFGDKRDTVSCGTSTIYSVKIWNDGEYVFDYVPCIQDLDDSVGLYDLANDQFYSNSGSGALTAGPRVKLSLPDDSVAAVRISDFKEGYWNYETSTFTESTFKAFRSVSNNTSTATNGISYAATLVPSVRYALPSQISVSVGGTVLTSGYTYDSTRGYLYIDGSAVSGDIIISAEMVDNNYSVTFNGEHTTSDAPSKTTSGDLSFTITADENYALPYTYGQYNVVVTVAEQMYTGYTFNWNDGSFTIPSDDLTGDVVVEVTSVYSGQMTYIWDETEHILGILGTDSMPDYDDSALYYAYPLTDIIDIDGSVTGVGSHAFSDFVYVTKLYIPASVNSIGAYAFDGCTSLNSVEFGSPVPCTLGESAFPAGVQILIPSGSSAAYKSAPGWSDYSDDIFETVEKPTADTTVFIFDNTEKTYSPVGFDSDLMEISGNKRTSSGTTEVTVSLKDTDTYRWSDGTSDPITFSFEIQKRAVSRPTADTTEFTYIYNTNQTYNPVGYAAEESWLTMQNNVHMDAGTYAVTVSLKYKDDSFWSDDQTSGDINFPFIINKRVFDRVTADTTVFVYDGTEQEYCPVGYVDNYMSITDNKKVHSGISTVEVHLNTNCKWSTGDESETLFFSFTMLQASVARPTEDTAVYTFDNTEKTYSPAGFNSTYMDIGGDYRATDSGTYYLWVEPNDDSKWNTGSAGETIDFTFVINKASVDRPSADTTVFTYNGQTQTYNPDGYDATYMNISGNQQTASGSYTVKVSPNENSKWSTAPESEEIQFTFNIAKASVVRPTADTTVFKFNGHEQTYTPDGYDATYMIISGNKETNVGNYTVKVSPNENSKWSTGTEDEEIQFTFTILTGEIERPTADTTEFVYNGKEQTYNPVGFDSYTMNISGNKQSTVGTHTVTVTPKDGCVWSTGIGDEEIKFDFVINSYVMEKPEANTTVFVYNGEEQVYLPIGYDAVHMSIANNIQTDAGTYIVTVAPKYGSIWDTGTGEPIYFDFTINKKVLTDPDAGSKVYNCGEQKSDLVSVTGIYEVTKNDYNTDAGKYDVILTMDTDYYKNHKWTSTEDQALTLCFEILKATISTITTDFECTYDGNEHYPEKSDLIYTGFTTGPAEASVSIVYPEEAKNAGEYVMQVTVGLDKNFNSYAGVCRYNILKLEVTEPTADTTEFIYDGSEKTYTPVNVDSLYMTVENNKRTVSGSQDVTVSLNDTANHMWKGLQGSDPLTFVFTVKKNIQTMPTADLTEFTYTGDEQCYNPVNFNESTMDRSGHLRTDAGSQTVTVSLKDKDNYLWTDETVDDLEFTFTILKQGYTVPSAGAKTYNCGLQKSDLTDISDVYTVEINEGGTDAGSYPVKLRLCDDYFANHKWSTTDEQDVYIVFSILKATLTSVVTDYTHVYTGEVHTPEKTDLIFNGFTVGPDLEKVTIALRTDGKTAGAQTMRIDVQDDKNFNDYLDGDVVYEITKAALNRPTAMSGEFTYTGEPQTYDPVGFDSETMDIADNEQTDAGDYDVTVSIKDIVNYQWSDGTQSEVYFVFTINKKELEHPTVDCKSYTGDTLTADIESIAGFYDVTENLGGIPVGEYDVKILMVASKFKNYKWVDDDDQEITIVFEIVKAEIGEITTDYTHVYDGLQHIPEVSDLKFTGFTQYPEEDNISIIYTSEQGITAGEYTLTVKVTGDSNFVDGTGQVTYKIGRASLNKPLDDETVYTYNGSEQTYIPVGFDEDMMEIADNKRTDAGYQMVHVNIKDTVNYTWGDGTQTVMQYRFNISKASYDMSGVVFKDGLLIYNGTQQHHEVTGELPTGQDGIIVTVTYSGYATYVNDEPALITAEFATESINYFTPAKMSAYLSIKPREVTVQDISAYERVYDGGVSVKLKTDDATVVDLIEGDDVTVTAKGHLSCKDCSDAQEAVIDSITIDGSDVSNYTLDQDSSQRTTTVKITKRPSQVIGATALSKVYDGNNEAEVSGTLLMSWLSIDDDVTVCAGKAYFSDRHAGTDKTVSFIDYYFTGKDAQNYECIQPEDCKADITQKLITLINGTRAISKEFDGTTDGITLVFGQHYTFEGMIYGDTVRLVEGKCVFDKNTVMASKVSVTSLGIDNTDYILQNAELKAYISSRNITVVNGSTPIEKVYDGTTAGSVLAKGVQYVFENTIDGYDVNLKNQSYTYKTSSAGTTTVSFKSYAVDNENYNLVRGTLSACIYKKELSIINGSEPITKVYDGTRTSSLADGQYIMSGIVSGDTVGLIDTAGNFDTAKVTARTFVLNSTAIDNDNYEVVSASLSASITKKDVIITGLSAEDKKYDDTVTAVVVGTPVIEGKISGDKVTVVEGYAEFDSKDSGNRTVYFYDYSITGADADNYNLAEQPASVKARITSYLGDGDSTTQILIGTAAVVIAMISLAVILSRRLH